MVVNTTGTTTSAPFSGTVTGFIDNTPGPGSCSATPIVQFSSPTCRVQENQQNVALTLTREGSLGTDATVHVATSAGTAQAGSDFTAKSTDVTIPAGAPSKTINIPITNDHVAESTEQFTVSLTPTAGVAIGNPGTATVTIIDKDGPPPTIEFAAATYGVHENEGFILVTVKRNGRQSNAVTAHYATSDGTAHAPGDYTASSGQVAFAAGGAEHDCNDHRPRLVSAAVVDLRVRAADRPLARWGIGDRAGDSNATVYRVIPSEAEGSRDAAVCPAAGFPGSAGLRSE